MHFRVLCRAIITDGCMLGPTKTKIQIQSSSWRSLTIKTPRKCIIRLVFFLLSLSLLCTVKWFSFKEPVHIYPPNLQMYCKKSSTYLSGLRLLVSKYKQFPPWHLMAVLPAVVATDGTKVILDLKLFNDLTVHLHSWFGVVVSSPAFKMCSSLSSI